MEPTKVLLVDDQSLMRLGFSMVLSAEEDIAVVGEASDGRAALQQVAALAPDVVLMDIRMPVMDGIEATRQIVSTYPETRVILLTTFDLDEYAFAGLKAGASGFLLKDVRPPQLVAAIRSVAAGDAVVSPRVTKRMLELFGARLPASAVAGTDREGQPGAEGGGGGAGEDSLEDVVAAEMESLTPKERAVFDQLILGLTNAEIAARLYVSEATVKTHVGSVLKKLGLRDRVHVVVYAYETGLLQPGEGNL
ncbi:MAG: response regulator transcription factor [Bifidobacteriaceae bacterium]|jgi:DNA-binding NarL/FixJ family response regulator|nr:response regulator transcription factor [Bifidobacteriaceae bacterium]